MSNKKPMKTLSIAAGTAFVASLAMGNVANAAEGANPFAMNELSGGYMQLADNHMGKGMNMGKGMEGNCGGKKGMDKNMPMGKGKEGKCGEGKCGGSKNMKKNMEGNCGGKKGMDKNMPMGKGKEGKCGEGKCGGSK